MSNFDTPRPPVERFEEAWRLGQAINVETWLSGQSLDLNDHELLELVHAEYRLRRLAGELPTDDEYIARFPTLTDRLRNLFEVERSFSTASAVETPNDSSTSQNTPFGGNDGVESHPIAPTFTVGLPKRYRVIRELGRGGMGTVLLALDESLSRLVAIKLPHFGSADEARKSRFLREARAIAVLDDHPGICRVHDVGETIQGNLYLSMAYVEGPNLHEVVKVRGALPQREAAQIALAICQALSHAHNKGILHRDLKPANVMLDRNGTPIVMDFGLAKVSFEADLTKSNETLGTLMYCAPEQLDGTQSVGPRSDVYSVGALLHELLTGQPPFTGSVSQILNQLLHGETPSPSKLRPELDANLNSICRQAMARDLNDRFDSMATMARELSEWLHRSPQETIRRNVPEPRKFASIRPWLFGSLIGAATTIGINLVTDRSQSDPKSTVQPTIESKAPSMQFYSEGLSEDLYDRVQILAENGGSLYAVEFCDRDGQQNPTASPGYIMMASATYSRGKGFAHPQSLNAIISSMPNELVNVVAYNDKGEWVVGTQSGMLRPDPGNGRPAKMNDYIQRVTDAGRSVCAVSFNDQGGWVVGTTDGHVERGGSGRPTRMDEAIDLLISDERVLTAIAFDDNGSWIVAGE